MVNQQVGTHLILFCPNMEQANQINQSWVGCSRISNPLRSSGFAAVIYSKGLTNILFVSFCPQWKPRRETKKSKSLKDEFVVIGYYRRQICCICISPSFLRSFWTLTNLCLVSYPPSILPRVSPRRFSQSLQSLSGDLGRRGGAPWSILKNVLNDMLFFLWFWSNHMSHMDHIEHVLHLLPVLALHCLVLFFVFWSYIHIFSWSLHSTQNLSSS